jgi:hypothetical protein
MLLQMPRVFTGRGKMKTGHAGFMRFFKQKRLEKRMETACFFAQRRSA